MGAEEPAISEDTVGRKLRKVAIRLGLILTWCACRAPRFCEKAAEVICRRAKSAETQFRNNLANFCG
ncbi:MAG: hypothetical protein LBQ12_05570 [Deltaproteobacteria bacterium]|jgi:hypothetical protein|nr:hypothetical protein [Deltaproteobacteria bacterium]